MVAGAAGARHEARKLRGGHGSAQGRCYEVADASERYGTRFRRYTGRTSPSEPGLGRGGGATGLDSSKPHDECKEYRRSTGSGNNVAGAQHALCISRPTRPARLLGLADPCYRALHFRQPGLPGARRERESAKQRLGYCLGRLSAHIRTTW